MTEYFRVSSDGGCEQYIEMTAKISKERCQLPNMDAKCKREFRRHVRNRAHVCLRGTMNARWKSAADREKCRDERQKNGRWQDVERYAAAMLNGEKFPPSLFLHPSITDGEADLLIPIDGARRLMADLEAGHSNIPIAIIRLSTGSL